MAEVYGAAFDYTYTMANHIVLVPQRLLSYPPSVREGISLAVEQQQRVYGCHLIQKAGVLLKLEAVSIASAQTILHRFYFRRSLKQFDVRRVATAALLLACKLEEDPRRVMHLIGVIWLLSQLEDKPELELCEDTLDSAIIDFDSQEYELFRMDVFRCERYILRELGFMVSQTLVHPHRYILQYIHALFKDNFIFTNQLSQKAWGYLNDSMRTTLCCEVQPAVIAVGSIFLAACDLQIPLPRETCWYELFDVSWEDVTKVCSTILSLYMQPLPSYLKLAEEVRPHRNGVSSHNSSSSANFTDRSSCYSRTGTGAVGKAYSKNSSTGTGGSVLKEAMAKPAADAAAPSSEKQDICEGFGATRDIERRSMGVVSAGAPASGLNDDSSGFSVFKSATDTTTLKRDNSSAALPSSAVALAPTSSSAEETHVLEQTATASAGVKGQEISESMNKEAVTVKQPEITTTRPLRAQPRAPPPLKKAGSHVLLRNSSNGSNVLSATTTPCDDRHGRPSGNECRSGSAPSSDFGNSSGLTDNSCSRCSDSRNGRRDSSSVNSCNTIGSSNHSSSSNSTRDIDPSAALRNQNSQTSFVNFSAACALFKGGADNSSTSLPADCNNGISTRNRHNSSEKENDYYIGSSRCSASPRSRSALFSCEKDRDVCTSVVLERSFRHSSGTLRSTKTDTRCDFEPRELQHVGRCSQLSPDSVSVPRTRKLLVWDSDTAENEMEDYKVSHRNLSRKRALKPDDYYVQKSESRSSGYDRSQRSLESKKPVSGSSNAARIHRDKSVSPGKSEKQSLRAFSPSSTPSSRNSAHTQAHRAPLTTSVACAFSSAASSPPREPASFPAAAVPPERSSSTAGGAGSNRDRQPVWSSCDRRHAGEPAFVEGEREGNFYKRRRSTDPVSAPSSVRSSSVSSCSRANSRRRRVDQLYGRV